MKDIELIPFVTQTDALSQAIQQEQFLAEIRQDAKYRQKRLAAYAAWSKPEAIAKRRVEHEAAAAAALESGKKLAEIAKEQIKADLEMRELSDVFKAPVNFTITPMIKTDAPLSKGEIKEMSKLQRLKAMFR